MVDQNLKTELVAELLIPASEDVDDLHFAFQILDRLVELNCQVRLTKSYINTNLEWECEVISSDGRPVAVYDKLPAEAVCFAAIKILQQRVRQ